MELVRPLEVKDFESFGLVPVGQWELVSVEPKECDASGFL